VYKNFQKDFAPMGDGVSAKKYDNDKELKKSKVVQLSEI